MLKEWLRKLTANYTEEEYKEYLQDTSDIYAYLEAAGIPKGKNVFKVPEIKGNERPKDVACLLSDVAENTGYSAEFLYGQFEEVVKDYQELGDTLINARKKAFEYVATVSYEHDW